MPLTRHEVRHTSDELPRLIEPMLADELELVILRQATTLYDMDAYDVQASVVGGTCETVESLKNAHALDLCVVLAICLARFAGDVPL